jgi:hypothetical protein
MSSHVIDVAIGIVYIYLVFSLICSTVNEGIAAVLSMRATNLEKGIKSLFSEDTQGAKPDFLQKIYSHALVRGLYKGPQLDTSLSRNWFSRVFRNNLPSYIPAGTFATALIGSIPGLGSDPTFDQVQEAIQKLPDSTTKQALLGLALNTKADVGQFLKNIETWFNDSMDRASGWYKRKTQCILLMIAMVVTVVANVDSVRIAKRLWNDPAQRQASVDAAQKFIDKKTQIQGSVTEGSEGELKKKIDLLAQDLPVGLPLGWHGTEKWDNFHMFTWDFFQMLFGWIFTALALSLGAPFWFDLLNKFMVVRSTVKPKEKAGKASKN